MYTLKRINYFIIILLLNSSRGHHVVLEQPTSKTETESRYMLKTDRKSYDMSVNVGSFTIDREKCSGMKRGSFFKILTSYWQNGYIRIYTIFVENLE